MYFCLRDAKGDRAVRLEILRSFIFGIPHPAHRALTPKKNEHYYLPWNPRTTDN